MEEAKLTMQLIYKVPIQCGSYKFTLPVDFYPDYEKMGADPSEKYEFDFKCDIKSTKRISQVSIPENATCTRDTTGTSVTVKCTEPSREISIFYRSDEMKYPHLVYAEDPAFPDEIAVCASFVPTFEPP